MKRSRPVLLAVLVVASLCALACGGVAACLGLVAGWQHGAVLADPTAVSTAGAAIADLDIPPELAPVSGMRMDVPFTDRPLVYQAVYEGADPLRYLMLFAIRKDAISDTAALRGAIERTLEAAIGSTTTELVLDREWTEAVLVHGVPVDFHLRRSTNAARTMEVTEASGMFDGTFGPTTVVFVTIGPFDDAAFRAMFK